MIYIVYYSFNEKDFAEEIKDDYKLYGIKDENLDSGISSNQNSRTGSVLFEKQHNNSQNSTKKITTSQTTQHIPQPVFSMIDETKEFDQK